jgi:hypothetical protein
MRGPVRTPARGRASTHQGFYSDQEEAQLFLGGLLPVRDDVGGIARMPHEAVWPAAGDGVSTFFLDAHRLGKEPVRGHPSGEHGLCQDRIDQRSRLDRQCQSRRPDAANRFTAMTNKLPKTWNIRFKTPVMTFGFSVD